MAKTYLQFKEILRAAVEATQQLHYACSTTKLCLESGYEAHILGDLRDSLGRKGEKGKGATEEMLTRKSPMAN